MKLLQGKRAFLELSLIFFLLALSFALYLTLTKRGERERGAPAFLASNRLNEGLNYYRLEDYERAGFILRGVLEKRTSKREGSIAALYLGNIAFLQGYYADALDFYTRALQLDKDNAFALYNSALACLKRGESDRALQYALRAMHIKESFTQNTILAGNIYRALGKYDQALDIYERAKEGGGLVKFNEASISLLLGKRNRAEELLKGTLYDKKSSGALRGMSHAVLGLMLPDQDRPKAIENVRYALEAFPGSPSLRYDCALLLMKEGRHGEALPILKSLGQRTADSDLSGGNLQMLHGIALFKNGSYHEALELYLSEFQRTGGSETASIIGDIYVKLGDLEGAKRYYQRSLESKSPGDMRKPGLFKRGPFLNLINIMIEEKRYEEGLKTCSDSIADASEDPVPFISMALIYFAIGENEKGKRALQQAASLSKDDLASLLRIAALYRENGLYNNALQIYYRVLSKDKNSFSALAGMARTYASTGHMEKARKAIGKAMQATADINIYYDLSLNLAQQESRDAAPLYEKLIREFPYRYEAYHNLALLSIKLGNYETAARLVEQCLSANRALDETAQAKLYVIMGVAQRAFGNAEKATQFFLKARQLDKNNPLPLLHLKGMGGRTGL